jgi:outer membrane biosynthesis protein TonB
MDTGAMKGIMFVSFALRSILLTTLCCAFLFIFIPANGRGADGDPASAVFSLDFKDKPLSQVLNQISRLTGAKFLINKEYAELKVTGSLKNVTVTQALREITAELNHTIIYEADDTISLVIYSKKQASGPGGFGPLPPQNYPMNPSFEGDANPEPEPPEPEPPQPTEPMEPDPNETAGAGEAVQDNQLPPEEQMPPEQAAENDAPEGPELESVPEAQDAVPEPEKE